MSLGLGLGLGFRWFSVWGPWVPRGHLGPYGLPPWAWAPPKAERLMSLGGPLGP